MMNRVFVKLNAGESEMDRIGSAKRWAANSYLCPAFLVFY